MIDPVETFIVTIKGVIKNLKGLSSLFKKIFRKKIQYYLKMRTHKDFYYFFF